MFLSLFLASALAPSPAQGLDALYARLLEQTAQRREAAEVLWQSTGVPWLAGDRDAIPRELGEAGQELQAPATSQLEVFLEKPEVHRRSIYRLLSLLEKIVNPSGANRIAYLLAQIPADLRSSAFALCCQKGDGPSFAEVEKFLQSKDIQEKLAALSALLAHGPIERIGPWLSTCDLNLGPDGFTETILQIIGQRDLPQGFFLPEFLFLSKDVRESAAILTILKKAPDPSREDWVVAILTDLSEIYDIRLASLIVAERGVAKMKWRSAERKMSALVRSRKPDALAEKVAWALFRLGQKDGKKWLLKEPKADAKDNPKDWRSLIRLGRMQVNVNEHKDGYRTFKEAIGLANLNRGRLQDFDWVWASRSAAGCRKYDEAGAWLSKARLSPQELKPFANLPEFEDCRLKAPFRRLFGL